MSNNLTFPIVGMRFRPPALALVDALAVGTPLMLIAEPENAFDVNAVAVWLNPADIPQAAYDTLRETLPPHGFTLEDVIGNDEPFHLGYIAQEFAAQLRACGAVGTDDSVAVTFAISNGMPRARFAEAPF